MTTNDLSLFRALGAKMDYINQRQRVISQNISNADTPGYKPMDLVEADFDRVLKKVTDSKKVMIERTSNQHFPPPSEIRDPKSRKQKETYEVAPAGNAVIMEEQLINAGQNMMDYNMMTNLYQKNIAMIRTALGSGQ
tara:strand:+ start:199 stop:609 length:411 start_codon:yes stop_codon:yes gene_type:complete